MIGKLGPPLTADRLRSIVEYDPRTGHFRWLVGCNKGRIAGSLNSGGYWVISIPQAEQRHFFAHRLAWLYMTGGWHPSDIDHHDLNRSNNKWDNLRPATHSLNLHNGVSLGGTSKFRGVCWSEERRRWCAYITRNGKTTGLGRYLKEEDAARARDKAALEYAGSYARLNFPMERNDGVRAV
jgi:hypothetical protein